MKNRVGLCIHACITAATILGLSGSAYAHHSNAAYDMDHVKTLGGTVKQVNWTNPHITFVIDKDAAAGDPGGTWVFEVSSPGVLTRSGWTKHSLKPGDHGSFRYAPLRDGSSSGYLLDVTLPDGTKLHYSLTPPDQSADK